MGRTRSVLVVVAASALFVVGTAAASASHADPPSNPCKVNGHRTDNATVITGATYGYYNSDNRYVGVSSPGGVTGANKYADVDGGSSTVEAHNDFTLAQVPADNRVTQVRVTSTGACVVVAGTKVPLP